MTEGYRSSGLEQIIARIDRANNEQVIYTPEVGTDGEGQPLPFFSFVDTLRMKISIPSLAETPLPEDFDELSETAKRNALRGIMYVSAHMIFDLILEKNGLQIIPASIGIIYRNPFYHFSLLTYLTDAAVWPVAAGVVVKARVRDVGWGGLDIGDHVDIFGSARTEAPAFTAPTQQINIYGAGGSGPPAPPANQVTMNGEPVTMNGEPVTMTPD
jgi:hypothetical protein